MKKTYSLPLFFICVCLVSAFIPGQAPKKVFHCVGMNVAKAELDKTSNQLKMTSRELTYYLSPDSDGSSKLEKWDNPWTEEKNLPVVHIANDPVQMALPARIPLTVRSNPYGTTSAIITEVSTTGTPCFSRFYLTFYF
jgi:hypothetical protein